MTNPKFIAKIESEEPTLRLAVLIDADNAQAAIIKELLAEIAKYGEATVRRIYGDFTAPTSASWKKVLQIFAIKPMQQFAYTTGKNATDSTMIIDAMDLLYTRKFDGFCLITSDSDFTGLAIRLREEGLTVLGFGEEKTPESFRSACNKFILTELLRPNNTSKPTSTKEKERCENNEQQEFSKNKDFPKDFMLSALEQSSDESGWAQLGTFGSHLTKLKSDFDPRLYGYKKLFELVRARTDLFLTEERKAPNGTNKNLYLKIKE